MFKIVGISIVYGFSIFGAITAYRRHKELVRLAMTNTPV